MKVLKGIDQISREEWTSFLASNPYTSPFQSPAYLDFFNSISEAFSASVYAIRSEGMIQALCVVTIQKEKGIKGFFSRRAIVYGGPLVSDDKKEALHVLLNAIEKDLRNKVIYLEIRNYHDYRDWYPVYEKLEWNYLPYMNVYLDMENKSVEDLLSNMKYNRRRQISLSQEQKATYQLAEKEEDIKYLYAQLVSLYQERVKLPLPPYEYFYQLFLSEIGKIFIVKHDNKVIGGAFCLALERQGIYTLYYCGLRGYHKKIFATHLAVLGAVEYGIQNKLKLLDFMGAGLKDEEYGVRQYKVEFGGELVEQGRFIKIFNSGLYRLGKLGLNMLQKIKG